MTREEHVDVRGEIVGAAAAARAGFWVRLAAGLIDLTILAIPLSVFVSLLSVGMEISNAFVDLNPHIFWRTVCASESCPASEQFMIRLRDAWFCESVRSLFFQ